jgi:methylglyoxal synthase/RimJ/RimL family protein N-acetyltransferase
MDEISTTGRLAHYAVDFGSPVETPPLPEPAAPALIRRPTLALTAEGPRRADLIAWAGAHRETLARMRLLAPAGIGALLAEHCGLSTEPLKSGTLGPAATAGLAAAGDIDAMIAFSDPIELRPGDTTTRSLARLAVFWDIPIAGNRATADLLLATVTAANSLPQLDAARPVIEPVRGAVRLWTVRATVDDVPGRLAILAASLARRAINILSVHVHLTADGPVDELLVAASPVLTGADLTAAVIDGGARAPRVAAADAHALVDAPTRALALATRLVRGPEELPQVLTSLLPGAELAWRAEPPPGHADNATELWLTDPAGGGYLLSRPAAPFTPAECARAYAMIDVATVVQVQARGGLVEPPAPIWRLLLGDGREVGLRRATPDDVDAVTDLHARSSATARPRRQLAGLLSPEAGYGLVGEDTTGRVIGLGSLAWDGEIPELGLLVDDGWQRQRIGTALARRLAATALEAGASKVRAVVNPGNAAMVRIMTALGQRMHREYDAGLLTLIVSLHHPAAL